MKPLLGAEEYHRYPILYVDDESLALETFQAQFRDDFTVYTCLDGLEAQDIMHKHDIAVVLADQRMPRFSGTELLTQIKKQYPQTIRMLITAYSDMDVVVEAINAGNVYRYLNKPYEEDDLRNTIRQGIETYYLIKERERLEAEKIELLQRMERSNRLAAIGTLASGMAHEINNPLTAVSAFLQMIPSKRRESPRDEEYWDEFYKKVCEEMDRIHNLISRMLRYSRFSAHEEYSFQETDLNELLGGMVTLLKHEAGKKENTLKKEFDPALPKGKMDSERMKQVFMNLLLNAIQATEKGSIALRTALVRDPDGGSMLEIAVSDTGVGIPDKDFAHLFDPFFTTKYHEGSGLGLLTCHQIVEAHRGYIDVKSQSGLGATFTVKIPLDPAEHDRRNLERRNEANSTST